MEKTRIVTSWSRHNLPSELWPEILSCLPVKSLLRFRCVSKSWRSLIDAPNFCRSHLINFKNSNLETHLVVNVFIPAEHVCAVYCSKTFTNSAVLDPLQPSNGCTKNHSNFNHWDIVCSLDGLVLLRLYSTEGLELTLWNPSIRRARVLHVSRTRSESGKYFDLGFGFDPIIKDYKLVRFVERGESTSDSFEIYTVGSGTWRTIQNQDAVGSEWLYISSKWRSLCCRGVLYLTPRLIHSGAQELVSFDLRSEVFASISFPIDDDIPIDEGILVLLDGGCSLGLATVSCTSGSIWVLESSGADIDSVYWTKRYSFASRIFPSLRTWCYFLYIKKNGKMLVHLRRQVISYDLETHDEKTLLDDRKMGMDVVHSFVESLLLLNG